MNYLDLEFSAHRYLRLLCRRGFLISRPDQDEKVAVYQRSSTWPPPVGFFTAGAIGFTYYLQKWVA
jgi:hypothetical protein